ncbi:MAG TPA: hypothetical protein VN704_05660, partial [Verrucomicrobiae bacterium]|nr:hypothetical protein [Verrucomicrobiae bacterium]
WKRSDSSVALRLLVYIKERGVVVGSLENAFNRLKEEGHTSEEIKKALQKMKEEAAQAETIESTLEEYLESLDDSTE